MDNNDTNAPNSPEKIALYKPKKKNKKIMYTLALLAVLLLGASLWFALNNEEDTNINLTGEEAYVSVVSGAFVPQTLIIEAGTTVVWQNDDTEPHWVASNSHPEHNELMGFDSEEIFGPGDYYAYTFNETGSYNYHDHVNPVVNGTIIVIDKQ